MTPREYFGLLHNIPLIQSLRIIEGAASLALLFAPSATSPLLKEIGEGSAATAKNIYSFGKHETEHLKSLLR